MDWRSPTPIGERGGQIQMRGRDPAVVLSVACDIAVVLRNELHGARRSDSREGGNRTRVHINRFSYLPGFSVPQRCLTHFRLVPDPGRFPVNYSGKTIEFVRNSPFESNSQVNLPCFTSRTVSSVLFSQALSTPSQQA